MFTQRQSDHISQLIKVTNFFKDLTPVKSIFYANKNLTELNSSRILNYGTQQMTNKPPKNLIILYFQQPDIFSKLKKSM